MQRTINTLFVTLVLVTNYPAYSLSSDPDQAIDIKANQVELDDQAGTNRYIGNVHMSQGSIEITADQIEIISVNNEVEHLVVIGTTNHQARFRQTTDEGQEILAYANRIEYLEKKTRLLLLGNATLNKNQSQIRGDKIDYNTRSHKLIAGNQPTSESKEKERVHVIIQPKSDKQ